MTIVLPGSLGDLIIQAEGRPIYYTAPSGVRRKLIALAIDTFRREFPGAEFIDALILDRHCRWGPERDNYGAVIIITRATNPDASADLIDGITGEHALNELVFSEIEHFANTGRPLAWQAIEFPSAYWFSRFAIKPFECISRARFARILPDPDAERFRPNITSIFGDAAGEFAELFRELMGGER